MKKIKLVYIISDIDKALAFEWIATYIDKERFDVSFIILNPYISALEHFLQAHNIKFTHIQCGGKKDWFMAWMKLVIYLIKNKPDIVHCHLLQANILGLTAARFASIPKRIYTRHHSDYHFRYFPKGVKWDKLANALSTKIIAPSLGVKQVLTDMEHVKASKISVVNHGFDLDYFQNVAQDIQDELKNKYNVRNQFPVIGVISRFTELKGIQYIIPAFQQLLLEYPDALLLLFNARGDYEGSIQKLLQQLPANSYQCVVFEPELAAVYTLFDVFVQVSTDTHIEAFGQTYIEALAAGVPSVFTLSGIAPDFIRDRGNAIVVPFKDSDSIYNGIKELLRNHELRSKLIAEGRKSIEKRFSLQEMIAQLTNVYTQ